MFNSHSKNGQLFFELPLKLKKKISSKKMASSKFSHDEAPDKYEPCVPDTNDDGSSRLDCFLRDYKRVTRAYACRQWTDATPDVWVYTNNRWTSLDPNKIASMIQKISPDGSICGALKANLFKLNRPLRDATEHAFTHADSPQIVGLYENKFVPGRFAIVVDLKKQDIPWFWLAPSFYYGRHPSSLLPHFTWSRVLQ